MDIDERERHDIEAKLTDIEHRLAMTERGQAEGDAPALTAERNRLRGRLAEHGRAADGTPLVEVESAFEELR